MCSAPPPFSLLDRFHRLGVIGCPLAIVALLSFSSFALHDYTAHFRLGGLGRVVARHTPVSPVHDRPRPKLIAVHFEPIALILMPLLILSDHFECDAAGYPSLVTRFHRLRLGPRGDRDAEPIV